MRPTSRRLTLAVAVLALLVTAGALGVLWTEGEGPDPPDPVRVDAAADPSRLLGAAARNELAFPRRATAVLYDRASGSVRYRARVADDPAAARFHRTVLHRASGLPSEGADATYLTGYGGWVREGGEWHRSRRETRYGDVYRGLVKTDFGAFEGATYEKRVHPNGSVTVRVGNVSSPGYPFVEGRGTLTYRLGFVDGAPFPERVVVRSVSSDREWVVDQTYGATVERPDGLGPPTLREVAERLRSGLGRV